MRPEIKEVIVVEGKKDTEKIQLAVVADTIETQGIALEPETMEMIKHAQKVKGVIVLTDPDYPGEMIRKKITAAVPGVKHAFITTDEGAPKTKGTLGIEHASIETIQKALAGLYQVEEGNQDLIPRSFLREQGLMNGRNSKQLRILLGEKLRIGYTNSKQLQKRLNMFGISAQEIKEVMKEIKEEGSSE